MVFSPYWNIPDSILRKETLPRVVRDPEHENALGLVKFIFPNNFQVYLHDTPDQRLFSRERRTFSHGCVRVEEPVALAQCLLANRAEWTEPRIRAAMRDHQEQTATLAEPLPVHIGYWTAWVQPRYLDDPYGFDARQAGAWRDS